MNKTFTLFIFILIYNIALAQVSLSGSLAGKNVNALDSAASEVTSIHILMDSVGLVVLSASDTGLSTDTHSVSPNKSGCVLTFIGCDEEHRFISDFTSFFYAEYFKTNNYETAFLKANNYLLNKYPDCPVTPVMNCKK